jgi:hypothetical protein
MLPIIEFTITPTQLTDNPGDPLNVVVYIGDNNFLTLTLMAEEDGSLYYRVSEDANPDMVIEGHYPEYFEEE